MCATYFFEARGFQRQIFVPKIFYTIIFDVDERCEFAFYIFSLPLMFFIFFSATTKTIAAPLSMIFFRTLFLGTAATRRVC